MVAQNNNSQLLDVMNALKADIFMNMNCVQIGIIESFNAANQFATIRIALKQVIAENPDGTRTLQEKPLLLECPVFMLYGGSSYLTFPIAAGDNCLVLFNDREIDNWVYDGGVQTPTTARAHDLSDAFALVGIKSFQNSIANYLTNGIRLAFDSNTKIDITNHQIEALATLFLHQGNVRINGDLTINGDTYGDGSNNWNIKANVRQQTGYSMHAGNGASGTFNYVTVVDGIVISGS